VVPVTLVKNGLKSANGPPLHSTVLIPLTAQDYSAQVAEATDGTDCILGVFSESAWAPFLTAYASSGGTQRLYGPQGNLDQKIISKFPADVTNGAVVVGVYSDISLPVWADYRAALAQYKARRTRTTTASAVWAPGRPTWHSPRSLRPWPARPIPPPSWLRRK
jgi:ABC-type branched-subunit amino acid transport system substrate-binding protein